MNNCELNPKLRLYKSIKNSFGIEPYLYINVEKYRVAMSRLRLSSHNLGIEVGRHVRPMVPVDKRLCVECEGEIDDEVHFLTVCKKYKSIRKDMLEQVCIGNPLVAQLRGRELFLELLTAQDLDTLVCVGKFVHLCWKS